MLYMSGNILGCTTFNHVSQRFFDYFVVVMMMMVPKSHSGTVIISVDLPKHLDNEVLCRFI